MVCSARPAHGARRGAAHARAGCRRWPARPRASRPVQPAAGRRSGQVGRREPQRIAVGRHALEPLAVEARHVLRKRGAEAVAAGAQQRGVKAAGCSGGGVEAWGGAQRRPAAGACARAELLAVQHKGAAPVAVDAAGTAAAVAVARGERPLEPAGLLGRGMRARHAQQVTLLDHKALRAASSEAATPCQRAMKAVGAAVGDAARAAVGDAGRGSGLAPMMGSGSGGLWGAATLARAHW